MAGRIRRYLTGFFEDDGGQPGLIERGDMPYLVKRDGTEIALEDLGSGGGGSPFNGGTITDPLIIDQSDDDATVALHVIAGSGSSVGIDVQVDPSDSQLRVKGLDNFGSIRVEDDFSGGASVLDSASLTTPNVIAPRVAISRELTIDGLGGGNPTPLLISDHNGDPLVQVRDGSTDHAAPLTVSRASGGAFVEIKTPDVNEANLRLLGIESQIGNLLEIFGLVGGVARLIVQVDIPGAAAATTLRSADPGDTVLVLHPIAAQTAGILNILNGAGDPVFRVNADGSVHIKTGTSIVADL